MKKMLALKQFIFELKDLLYHEHREHLNSFLNILKLAKSLINTILLF